MCCCRPTQSLSNLLVTVFTKSAIKSVRKRSSMKPGRQPVCKVVQFFVRYERVTIRNQCFELRSLEREAERRVEVVHHRARVYF